MDVTRMCYINSGINTGLGRENYLIGWEISVLPWNRNRMHMQLECWIFASKNWARFEHTYFCAKVLEGIWYLTFKEYTFIESVISIATFLMIFLHFLIQIVFHLIIGDNFRVLPCQSSSFNTPLVLFSFSVVKQNLSASCTSSDCHAPSPWPAWEVHQYEFCRYCMAPVYIKTTGSPYNYVQYI